MNSPTAPAHDITRHESPRAPSLRLPVSLTPPSSQFVSCPIPDRILLRILIGHRAEQANHITNKRQNQFQKIASYRVGITSFIWNAKTIFEIQFFYYKIKPAIISIMRNIMS
jgi:hypothetical protein